MAAKKTSVFDYFKTKFSTAESKRTIESLEMGMKYTPYNWTQVQSKFPSEKQGLKHFPTNLIAHLTIGSQKCFIYMPAAFNDLSTEHVQELNECISNKTPASVVYYGKVGIMDTDRKNVVRLVPFGEETDSKLLEECRVDTAAYEAAKARKEASSSQPPILFIIFVRFRCSPMVMGQNY